MRTEIMRQALQYASQFEAVVIAHCEDKNLSAGGVMNESALSTILGLPGIPSLAEETMVARDLLLSAEYGRLHVAHVSSARSVELVRRAKRQGWPVTCETCPHYFTLTEEAVKDYETNAKVNPPLKSPRDRQAIRRGLKDGTIDVIATDHAPHNLEAKAVEFNQAAFGMIGLETALALVLTKLVNTKVLTLKEAVAKLTVNPARILKLEKGTLRPGAVADVTIVDPKAEWLVKPAEFASKSRNTPLAGWRLQGRVVHTIVSGKLVVKDGKLIA
jgi:dihydroorotase